MHYLASWRMQVAMQRLRNTSTSLAQVADLIGYESEAAFSRAFKKAVGTAPATWRRSRGEPAEVPKDPLRDWYVCLRDARRPRRATLADRRPRRCF